MEGIFSQLVTKEMGFLAAGAIALMYILGSIPVSNIQKLRDLKLWQNFGIFILTVICIGGSFLPGVVNIPKEEWGNNIIFGLLATLSAHYGKKVLGPIFLDKLTGKTKKD